MADQDLSQETDEKLMDALGKGQHVAFEVLLQRYETKVVTFCYAFTRNRETAEDIAQETFLRVFRNAARYQPLAKFTTWLYKIAANLCINDLKKTKLRPHLSLEEPAGSNPEGSKIIDRVAGGESTPLNAAERSEIQGLLQKAIDHLPDDQRTTLILVEYHHMQYQEAAEVLEVSVSAIKMRVKRARETLSHSLRILRSEASTRDSKAP